MGLIAHDILIQDTWFALAVRQFELLWQREFFTRCRKAILDQTIGACLLHAGSAQLEEMRKRRHSLQSSRSP